MKARASRSGRTKIILAVAVLAVVVAATIVWFLFFAPPTKQDYARAASQADALKSATVQSEQATGKYVQAIISSLRLDPTGERLSDDVTAQRTDYTGSIERYERLLAELRQAKAVRDDDIAVKMQAVEKQSKTLRDTLARLTDAYPMLYKASISCDDVDRFLSTSNLVKDATAFNSASDDCVADLATLAGKSRVKSLAQYADTRRQIVDDQRSTYATAAETGADQAKAKTRLAELTAKSRFLDPLVLVQMERDRAVDTLAVDELITLLNTKAKN